MDSPGSPHACHVVVMGVSGTGKSTVGRCLADALGATFLEGDAHHPPQNRGKMAAGEPLSDADRQPWLDALADLLARAEATGTPTVLSCSALRRSYRDVLRAAVRPGTMFFVHLHGASELLRARLTARRGHFMPASLLQSQLATLEPLHPDEPGVVVEGAHTLDEVLRRSLDAIRTGP
jgi:carbohydrate kinase (thermoresistant glucokinase family)